MTSARRVCFARADQISGIHEPAADAAVERRVDLGITEVEFGRFQRRLLRQHLGGLAFLDRFRLVHLLLTDRAAAPGYAPAFGGQLGLFERRLCPRQVGLGRVHRGDILRLLDLEQQLALLDQVAILEKHLLEKAFDPCSQLDGLDRGDIAGELQIVGDRFLDGFGHGHLRRRRRHIGVLFLARAREQRDGEDHRDQPDEFSDGSPDCDQKNLALPSIALRLKLADELKWGLGVLNVHVRSYSCVP